MRPVALAVATTLLLSGLHRDAAADETTTCGIDSWGQLRCTTTSSIPTPGRRTIAGGFSALALTAMIVGLSQAGDTTPRSREISLGIVVGVEAFLTPLMVYVAEDALDPTLKARWRTTTTLTAEAWGGAVRDATETMTPVAGGRLTAGRGRLGLDAGGEAATDPGRYSLVAAHLLLRAPPRRIATLALALGASRIEMAGEVRTGLDVLVPHEYILSHDDTTGAPDVLLGIRSGLFISAEGTDVRFDAALVVPVASRLALEVGGGVFSFDSAIRYKGAAGLSLAL